MFEVMSRCCSQCLMSNDRIVSSKRAAEILRKCRREDVHFECHKGTEVGRHIACRAHYETGIGNLRRITERLGAVVEINPETLERVQ